MNMILQRCLSRWTGIPVEKLETSESEKLLHMDRHLKKRVIGQDEAIDKNCSCYSNSSRRA